LFIQSQHIKISNKQENKQNPRLPLFTIYSCFSTINPSQAECSKSKTFDGTIAKFGIL